MVNVKPVQLGKTTRMSFSKINEALEMPNLIEVQKNSYKWFLEEGLKEVFRDVAAITDYNGNLVLNFVDYSIDDTPKYSVAECKERDVTYAAPLRVKATLWNKETGVVKENEVFMGDFPLMTDSGTFVINGAERESYHSSFVLPVFTTHLKRIRPVRTFLNQLLSLTEVHGLSMKWTQTMLLM